MKTLSKISVLAGAVALLAGVASCSQKEETSKAADTTIAFSEIKGTAAYVLENSATDFHRDADVTFFDSASIVMPTVIYNQDITALQDSILKTAFDTVSTDHKQAMESYFKASANDFGYQAKELKNDSINLSDAGGIAIISGEVFNLNSDRLTYLVDVATSAPGDAHGITNSRFFTYSISKAKIINLSDIFTPEGLEKLPELIQKRASQLVSTLGPTDITTLPSQGNFYITLHNEVVFVYQPYEVASYAQGLITVPFAGYTLSEYLTPTGREILNL